MSSWTVSASRSSRAPARHIDASHTRFHGIPPSTTASGTSAAGRPASRGYVHESAEEAFRPWIGDEDSIDPRPVRRRSSRSEHSGSRRAQRQSVGGNASDSGASSPGGRAVAGARQGCSWRLRSVGAEPMDVTASTAAVVASTPWMRFCLASRSCQVCRAAPLPLPGLALLAHGPGLFPEEPMVSLACVMA